MADLIDRDLTIHELEAFKESCIANLLRMSFEDITDVVKDIPAVNRWIPCSERLPEKAGEYLVTYHPCYWDDVEWSKRCAGIDTFRGKSTWAKKKYQRVIAWMPMPDAYGPTEKE